MICMCAPEQEKNMQIYNMPVSERPREKLLFSGASGLSNAELLALIIRTGTGKKSAIQLADEVIAYTAANIGSLGTADVKELTRIDGIGLSKACSIVAALELSKRIMSDEKTSGRHRMRDSRDVVDILMKEMMYEKREIFMALILNTKMEIEAKQIISIGNLNTAPVHPREVFGPAIRRGAAAIVVAHNHPSGDPAPSDIDILMTKRLMDASEIIGINLLDHIIIGNNSYYSMKTEGMMGGER